MCPFLKSAYNRSAQELDDFLNSVNYFFNNQNTWKNSSSAMSIHIMQTDSAFSSLVLL